MLTEDDEAALRRLLKSKLRPKQGEVLLEYWQALQNGYLPSNKLGKSLEQFWSATEYSRKRRLQHLVRNAHPDLVEAVRKAAAGILTLQDVSALAQPPGPSA